MYIKQVADILNRTGKKVVYQVDQIKEDVRQDENFYQLEKTDKGWEYCFVICERRNTPIKEVKEVFSDEESGAKFYFLKRLSSFYYKEKVMPNSRNIEDFDEEIVRKEVNKLNIPQDYYSFKQERKPYSIQIEEKKGMLIVQFVGSDRQIYLETQPLELWEGYEVMYDRVYLIYLLKQMEDQLLQSGEVSSKFSNEDICIFL